MMKDLVLSIIIRGIQVKIERGEVLEDILATYVNLTDEEKEQIRTRLNDIKA